MIIAILGAGGFIGSHLVEQFIEHDEYQIIGVDISKEKLSGISGKNFVFHRFDIQKNDDLLNKIIQTADVVVDLIAFANPSLYVSDPLKVFQLNFLQNLKVLEYCIENRKKIFQYSSAEFYGKFDQGEYLSEDNSDSVLGPVHKQRWIYAAAKSLLERVIHAHGLAGDLEFTIVRPFNFIGNRYDYLVPPGTKGGPRVFAHFLSALLTGGPIYLVNGGHQHRAFTHILDGTKGFQTLLENPQQSHNEIFNIGNPYNNVTIRELALLMVEIYEELTGKTSKNELVEISGEEFYGKGYEDSTRLPPDIRKMRALGWEPKYDLRTTLRDTMLQYVSPSDPS